MKTLKERRQTLCLNFARKGLKIKAMQTLFPKIYKHNMKTKNGINMLSILLNPKNTFTIN